LIKPDFSPQNDKKKQYPGSKLYRFFNLDKYTGFLEMNKYRSSYGDDPSVCTMAY
jgi:hypothetical protein